MKLFVRVSQGIFLSVLIAMSVGLVAIPRLTWFQPKGYTQPGQRALAVQTHIMTPEPIEHTIQSTGTILANERVDLTSEVSGKITEIKFKEGQPVKKGDLLIKINDAELQARLQKAQYERDLAQSKEERQRQLLAKSGISQERYDETLNELNTFKAEIQLIQAQIDKTEIRAPFDGIVGLRHVSEGSYITPTTPIANLISLHPAKLDFSIPEKYVTAVQPGDAVMYQIQGSDEIFRGEIYAIEPNIDPETRTLLIRALCPNKEQKVLPGAFAKVDVVLENIEDALMLPSEALIPELGGQKVYIYQAGQAMPRPVETGLRTSQRVQITGGLAPGDTVITSGILQMRPGLPVTLSDFDR